MRADGVVLPHVVEQGVLPHVVGQSVQHREDDRGRHRKDDIESVDCNHTFWEIE